MKKSILGIVILTFAIAVFATCSTDKEPQVDLTSPGPKVAIIGLDGLGWNIIDPLIEQGKMPNFQRIMDTGVSGKLKSFEFYQLISQLIWPSIYTGKRPEKHGIQAWMVREDVVGDKWRIGNATDRTVKAVWEIASEEELSTMFVNFMCTYPPDSVNGVFVSDRAIFSNSGTVFPAGVFDFENKYKKKGHSHIDILEPYSNFSPLDNREEIYELSDELTKGEMHTLVKVLAEETENDHRITDATVDAIRKYGQPNLFGYYIHSPDMAQHFMFRYHSPESFTVNEKEKQVFGDFLNKYYERTDSLLGVVLDELDPETNIIVLSDHSLVPLIEENIPERSGGYDVMQELFPDYNTYKVPRQISFNVMRSIINDAIAALGMQVIISEPAYLSMETIGTLTYWDLLDNSGNRLNDFESFNKAISDIRKISIPGKGNLFIDASKTAENRLQLHINPDIEPDDKIMVTAEKSYPADSLVMLHTAISGWHEQYGIILAKGPAFKRGYRYDEGTVLDITPTTLYLMGLPVAEDMDGRVMQGMFAEDFLENHKITYIPTYEDSLSRQNAVNLVEGEEELKEKLRALGYIN
ncbi:MAG: hypothetical protein GF307_06065 [candidate division Zixibacteria bacterium]|nr:hypothetical protein [candidate division Zixibacteria bacterium]